MFTLGPSLMLYTGDMFSQQSDVDVVIRADIIIAAEVSQQVIQSALDMGQFTVWR